MLSNRISGKYMNQQMAVKQRREVKANMATVFGEKINILSTELREILLDDIVTAFENRLIVLNRAEVKR
jgi:hypothetical protein